MKKPIKKHKEYPKDFKAEVRQMYKEGLKPTAIGRYVGVSKWVVEYILHGTRYSKTRKTYYLKNKKKILVKARKYNKWWYKKNGKEHNKKRREQYLKNKKKEGVVISQ